LKPYNNIGGFFIKEWLLVLSGLGLIVTSILSRHLPSLSTQELETLLILFALFVSVTGITHSGLLKLIVKSIAAVRAKAFFLVITTFFLSMIVTNDVAIILIVPLTIAMTIDNKDILIILEAVAANAGSALTPFGNPQNLYIYWYYRLTPGKFVMAILPFSIAFLAAITIASLLFKLNNRQKSTTGVADSSISMVSVLHLLSLATTVLVVLHILPIAACLAVILIAVVFDPKALKIDYSLLIIFLFLFGLAENMKVLLEHEITHSRHVFLVTSLGSQLVSNVPAALIFAKFTTSWKALLWGTNAGGFGSPISSLANIIAYRLYTGANPAGRTIAFTVKFLVIGYSALAMASILYLILDI